MKSSHNTPKDKNISFTLYLRQIINRLRQLNKHGTADNYQSALNSLSCFVDNREISCKHITPSFIEDYEAWLRSRHVSQNSSSAYMRSIRAAYRRAVAEGLTDDLMPFRNVFTGVAKTKKRALSISEIKKIKNLDLSLTPGLERIRDIFLFQFYALGISFIDTAFLKKSYQNGNIIQYVRHKTGQRIVIPLNEHIRQVIRRHNDPSSPYLLPIIGVPGTDERRQYQTALRAFNAGLKTIGKLCGIGTHITTYVTRHTWASVAKHKGINIATISDALGHDSIKTTQIYLQTIDCDEIARANSIILADL